MNTSPPNTISYPPLVLDPPLRVHTVSDWDGLVRLQDWFTRCGPEVGWDIETSMEEDWSLRKVRTVQFGNRDDQYVIDLLPFEPDLTRQGHCGRDASPALVSVIDSFRNVVNGRKLRKIGVNLQFECQQMYWSFGLRPQHLFDCMIVERVIHAGLNTLKDFSFFSMEKLMHRYYQVQIDKQYQTSFDLTSLLSTPQIEYAALDTRVPFAIRKKQQYIIDGHPYPAEPGWSQIQERLFGDDLNRVCQLENDAICSFADMQVHGDRLDTARWNARVTRQAQELHDLIENKLDPLFLPIVGSMDDLATDEALAATKDRWHQLSKVTPQELALRKDIRKLSKMPLLVHELAETEQKLATIETRRLDERERLKEHEADRRRQRTEGKATKGKSKLGKAILNFESWSQILAVLNDKANWHAFPGLEDALAVAGQDCLLDLEEDTLVPFIEVPVIKLLQEKTKLTKQLSTYGKNWTQEWVTKPDKVQGWLSPIDHRLHCNFHQLEAETGRSASSRPNAQNVPALPEYRMCFIASEPDDLAPEGYVLVTADMSGAELRILAELSKEPRWLQAFWDHEDVHDVCIEVADREMWYGLERKADCLYFSEINGKMRRKKCKCPEHDATRTAWKCTNFGLPYGIGPLTLATQINKAAEDNAKKRERDGEPPNRKPPKGKADVEAIMEAHRKAFPKTWDYLGKSATMAREEMASYDMFGRRRLFTEPDRQEAEKKAKRSNDKALRLSREERFQALRDLRLFIRDTEARLPTPAERYDVTHYQIPEGEISKAMKAMDGTIHRQGKNHPIQGTNASIAKVAMGSGVDKDGNPFLFHLLPEYHARLIKFVHDEFVVECPARYGKTVSDLIGSAFRRAAAEVMRSLDMEFESHIDTYWHK